MEQNNHAAALQIEFCEPMEALWCIKPARDCRDRIALCEARSTVAGVDSHSWTQRESYIIGTNHCSHVGAFRSGRVLRGWQKYRGYAIALA